MIGLGYDYSYAPGVDLDEVKANGALFVARYLDGPNRLTEAEAVQIHARGLGILPIYEHGNRDADSPWLAPQYANDADRLCDLLGIPLDVPVLHCDDFNDPIDLEPDFFRLVSLNSRRPVMSYGSLELWEVVRGLGVRYGMAVGTWGPNAPESGRGGLTYEPDIHCVQLANTHSIGGTDDIVVLKPFPTWGGQTGGDMPLNTQDLEAIKAYLFDEIPEGIGAGHSRFEAALGDALQRVSFPTFDGKRRSFLDWIGLAVKANSAAVDPKVIADAVKAAVKDLPNGSVNAQALADAVADEIRDRMAN